MANDNLYIHELIDITGANRAKYMQHMTANWCPVAREERNQLCYGVWGTVGSTGAWPEVVNMWEVSGWDGLAADFAHELTHPGMQDPALAEWWGVAASLRRGGCDRILEPAPWVPSIAELCASGRTGAAVYGHEIHLTPAGRAPELLERLASAAEPAAAALGVDLLGGFRVAMADDSECVVLWSFPDWSTWVAFEREWTPTGAMAAWRSTLIGLGSHFRRTLLVDAPLSPLRTGRQPTVEDRQPL